MEGYPHVITVWSSHVPPTYRHISKEKLQNVSQFAQQFQNEGVVVGGSEYDLVHKEPEDIYRKMIMSNFFV